MTAAIPPQPKSHRPPAIPHRCAGGLPDISDRCCACRFGGVSSLPLAGSARLLRVAAAPARSVQSKRPGDTRRLRAGAFYRQQPGGCGRTSRSPTGSAPFMSSEDLRLPTSTSTKMRPGSTFYRHTSTGRPASRELGSETWRDRRWHRSTICCSSNIWFRPAARRPVRKSVGVNDLQLALKSSYLREMTKDIHMSWTFSQQPPKGLLGQFALARFYDRILDWRRKANLGPTQTHEAGGYNTWRKCRQTAPQEKLVDQLPDLAAPLAEYHANLNRLADYADRYERRWCF
jgi:hypothetical protein